MTNIKSSAVNGVIWTAVEKFSRQLVQFVIGIILARLLNPEEFGIIGMLGIFLAVAQTFSDSGLSSALIQKQKCTNEDYSTIFYFNVIVSFLFYLIIFCSAPYIASFYHMPILKNVARVVALTLVISGLTSVQGTRLTKDLRFREQSMISIISMFLTGGTGLTLAYLGWGVWALVFQSLVGQLFSSACIWYISKWKPSFLFSKTSFKQLWKFGSKLLCSSLINTIYSNIYTLVIGKAFAPAEVGYYNRGNQYALLPTQTLQNMALRVNYPILAKFQDDNEQLLRAYKKLMSVPLYILYPILTGLAVTAPTLIPVMIGDKWIPCVPILQILCIGYMFTPLTHINLNLLFVKGRTDLVLKLELIKKPIAFLILFSSIPFGLIWMIIGKAIYEFVAFSFNCYYTGKTLGYGELKQLSALFPIFANCAMMAIIVYVVMLPIDNSYMKLLVGIPVGVISYILYSVLTKDQNYFEIVEIIKSINNNRVNGKTFNNNSSDI